MKKYIATLIKHFKQVQVVHHLPGRLRLYIPLLEKLPTDWHRYQSDLIDIIKHHKGIIDIEISVISGRVLVYYDPNHTSKAQLLSWLKDLAARIYDGYTNDPFQSEQQIRPFLKKIRCQSRNDIKNKGDVREVA